MSRPYTFDPKTRSYRVMDQWGNTVSRKTRTAAGMTATNARRKAQLSNDASKLSVYGTTAKPICSMFHKRAVRHKCPCCRQSVMHYALSEGGKLRLQWLRHMARCRAKEARSN